MTWKVTRRIVGRWWGDLRRQCKWVVFVEGDEEEVVFGEQSREVSIGLLHGRVGVSRCSRGLVGAVRGTAIVGGDLVDVVSDRAVGVEVGTS